MSDYRFIELSQRLLITNTYLSPPAEKGNWLLVEASLLGLLWLKVKDPVHWAYFATDTTDVPKDPANKGRALGWSIAFVLPAVTDGHVRPVFIWQRKLSPTEPRPATAHPSGGAVEPSAK